MNGAKAMQEKLREAACFGDQENVHTLVQAGVDLNSQHDINGWYKFSIVFYVDEKVNLNIEQDCNCATAVETFRENTFLVKYSKKQI